MATNLQSQRIASLGKRLLNQISNGTIPNYANLGAVAGRRGVHVSVYDKNLEEPVQPSIVPDEVIKGHSANYWTPHPQTGVFRPTIDQSTGGERGFHSSGGERGFHSSPAFTSEDSSLDEMAFFRPLEDLDKPLQI